MQPKQNSQRTPWLTKLIGCLVIALLIGAAKAESLSESARPLIGHWRATTFDYGEPRDSHLLLKANGTVEAWDVTASVRGEQATGKWNVDGKTLLIVFEGDNNQSAPFAIFEGKLVYPNIANARKFWERIE
jgi:hypothetical protein